MNSLGFFREPLKLTEILIFFAAFFLISVNYYLIQQNSDIEIAKNINSALLVILWFIPIATPFAEKLRNIYIFSIWGMLCIFCISVDKGLLSFLPMFSLLYSTLCRLLFKIMFKYFPIQLWGSWFATNRYSKIEKRFSNKKDLNFSVIIFLSGLTIPLIIAYFIK